MKHSTIADRFICRRAPAFCFLSILLLNLPTPSPLRGGEFQFGAGNPAPLLGGAGAGGGFSVPTHMRSKTQLSKKHASTAVRTDNGTRPNILFIFLDDFGWRDSGFMGSDFYETPHLDKLAREGMIFTDAYAGAANCAPSRACLLSGQYSPRHRIFNVGTRPRGNAKHRRLLHIPGTSTLAPETVTWAERLQAAGYKTGMFGKWHLGTSPQEQGFDVAVDHRKLPGFKGHIGPNETYLASVLTDYTIDFIRDQKDNPWCAYLAHFSVHTPLQAKTDLLPKYEAKKPGKLHNHVVMATMIQAVDDGVDRILAEIESLNLRRNTVIIFTSDNGGYGPATDMDPLWGYKGNYYEGGIREPFFINWPGVIKEGTKTSVPVHNIDLYPTLCEIAGTSLPTGQARDGVSLIPLLKGETDNLGTRALFWHFPAYLESYTVYREQRDPIFRTRPCSIIRYGDWKLHQYFEDGALELYNLRDDIGERNDLSESNPEKTQELLTRLESWRSEINAPIPSEANPDFDEQAETTAIETALRNMEKPSGD